MHKVHEVQGRQVVTVAVREGDEARREQADAGGFFALENAGQNQRHDDEHKQPEGDEAKRAALMAQPAKFQQQGEDEQESGKQEELDPLHYKFILKSYHVALLLAT